MQTECCNRPVCDSSKTEEDTSHILDICSRNHREYTLCGLHIKEHHEETCDWRECSKCKEHLRHLERYVGYGSSRYNFKGDWLDPPTFEPTHCAQCGEMIKLNTVAFIEKADGMIICQKHQQLPPSVAKNLISMGN